MLYVNKHESLSWKNLMLYLPVFVYTFYVILYFEVFFNTTKISMSIILFLKLLVSGNGYSLLWADLFFFEIHDL